MSKPVWEMNHAERMKWARRQRRRREFWNTVWPVLVVLGAILIAPLVGAIVYLLTGPFAHLILYP